MVSQTGCAQLASTVPRRHADLTVHRRERMQQLRARVAHDIAGAMVCARVFVCTCISAFRTKNGEHYLAVQRVHRLQVYRLIKQYARLAHRVNC
jgi:hypothetical protein